MNILLVEDDAVNQKIASQFLMKWGINVTVANDGLEAINLLHQRIFRLILMDINMPEMDGCEATQNIRSIEDPYFKNIPILAFTASTLADSKEKAEKLGMNDFIRKPLDPEDMHRKINYYMIYDLIESRPLRIKFELYADSNPAFKMELISLMISNLRELQHASYKSYYTGELKLFQSSSHKVKSTLILLDDPEYDYIVETLKQALLSASRPDDIHQKIYKFNWFTESIIKALEDEATSLATTT